jgi:tetratricopeptide (TPR) repeat protein
VTPDSLLPSAGAQAQANAWAIALVAACCIVAAPPARAQLSPVVPPAVPAAPAPPAPPSAPSTLAPPTASPLDAPLFYQLLIGEIELRGGQPGTAYEVFLDAARRTKDESLFRRATDIALQARAGDQALAATRAWRTANPASLDAVRLQLQILLALNRPTEVAEPLRALVTMTPPGERATVIAVLPAFLQRLPDRRQAALVLEDALRPLEDASTRAAARSALGRAWLAAGDPDRAVALAREGLAAEPPSATAALLAIELIRERPEAEPLVRQYLVREAPQATGVRLAYARTLMLAQRYADATTQLEAVTSRQPELAAPWLTLGALRIELKEPKAAEAALQRFLELNALESAAAVAGRSPAAGAARGDAGEGDESDEGNDDSPASGATQARLLLAQAAEQRGDFAAAEAQLARIDDPKRALDVQTRRAMLLARQGRVEDARALVRRVPATGDAEVRARLVAEASVLREVRQWQPAYTVLADAAGRFPQDANLLYEQAMMAEKLDRIDEMERLLRRVIELEPANAHAHNALGYSLADRGMRLPEARDLIRRALELAPGDPFITDSLGWVEFRLGNADEALRHLRAAFAARPDTEIGAHLGEVLWSRGDRDEARRIWRDVRQRDPGNEVLRETLARLRVDL